MRDCEADPVAAENLRKGLVVCSWKAGCVAVQESLSGGMKLGACRFVSDGQMALSWTEDFAPYLLT